MDDRPPSAATIREAAHGRELISRGVTYRGRLREAIIAVDADRADLARHRVESQNATKMEDRAKAAAWKHTSERKLLICELKWQLQDPFVRQALHFGESREGRIMPSPVQMQPEEVVEVAPGKPMPEQRAVVSMKDSTLRPRRPLHLRLKHLRRNARRRQKDRGSITTEASDSGLEDSETSSEASTPEPVTGILQTMRKSMSKKASIRSSVQKKPSLRSSRSSVGVQKQASLRSSVGQRDAGFEGRESVASKQGVTGDFTDRDAVVLSEAFSRHDEDHSGSLDQAELVECLDCLGLRPKTSQERKEVRQVIWNCDRLEFTFQEFSREVVPVVRAKLAELRRARLTVFFREVDKHNEGVVTVTETLTALRRHGTYVREEVCDEAYGAFHGVLARRKQESDESADDPNGEHASGLASPPVTGWKEATLGVDDFVEFARILEEHTDRDSQTQFARTAQLHGITPEEEETWRYDLLEVNRMFHVYEPVSGCYGSSAGLLDEAQFLVVVRESGYMPRGKQKHLATDYFHKVQHSDGTIGFTEFLVIFKKLRDLDRDRLRRVVEAHLPERSGVVQTSDVSDLLRDTGIVARSPIERLEIAALVEESQSFGAHSMGKEDVVVLCQRIASKLKVMRQERERQYVLHVGWTEQHYCEFRSAFQVFDEDMSGVLERSELMKAVEMLKGHYWQSSHNMNLMFIALHIDPHKEMKVDFLTFLRLLKMLDDSEARRDAGALLGFARDRTDKFFSCFQALDPESSGTVRRDIVQRALTGATARSLAKSQIDEVLRQISNEPLQVPFTGFLRGLKVVEALMEGDMEECINDLISWHEAKLKHESDEARRRPSLLRLIRGDDDARGAF